MTTTNGLLIGTAAVEIDILGASLGVEVERRNPREPIEPWRERVAGGDPRQWVTVAMWLTAPPSRTPMLDLSDESWDRRIHAMVVEWVAGLGAAVRRCADGGRVIAVVERPSPLDGAGHAAEAAVADAVTALVRSLGRSQGPRNVRVNAVTTPTRLAPPVVIAPAPPLPSFPGGIDPEVSAVVQMLSGLGATGLTGTVVHADCGRSW